MVLITKQPGYSVGMFSGGRSLSVTAVIHFKHSEGLPLDHWLLLRFSGECATQRDVEFASVRILRLLEHIRMGGCVSSVELCLLPPAPFPTPTAGSPPPLSAPHPHPAKPALTSLEGCGATVPSAQESHGKCILRRQLIEGNGSSCPSV